MVPLPDPHDTWSMPRDLAHLSDEALVALVAAVGRACARRALRPLRPRRVRARVPDAARRRSRRTRCRRPSSPSGAGRRLPFPSARRRGRGSSRSSTGGPSTSSAARSAAGPTRSRSRRDLPTSESAEDSAWLGFERERVQTGCSSCRIPAGGDRARLLRRLLAVGALRKARSAHRYDQEQDVHRPRALRELSGRTEEGSWNPQSTS